MKSLRKILAIALVALFTLSLLTACGGESEATTIRYLNFKPEIADVYSEIAAAYEKETGVKVIVETAANDTYEQTLMSKMSTDEAPTLFQINGPTGYANWKEYCADLTDTELAKHLTSKDLAISANGKIYGIPYVVEGYGIIYNQAIMDKYFALSDRATSYTSVDEINNFAKLKEVVEDMQARKDDLGIEGVFASTSLKSGEAWRWQTHLANLPVYYEFNDNNIEITSEETDKIDFTYSDNFKNIFDLYLNNSTVESTKLGTKTVDDSMAEFALEKCAMVQNGNWGWGQISGVQGNKVKSEDVKYLPIYTGVEGEETQGLCVGTENYFCINSQASEAEQKATADFIYWLYSSETGKDFVTNKLGFITPFDTFESDEIPSDPLAQEVAKWMEKDGVTTVPWSFLAFPSQTFKDNFGDALLQYAQGTKTWEEVKTLVVKDWASESAAVE